MSVCLYKCTGGMLLPYDQARHSMFQQLQPQFPLPPTSPVSHGLTINEASLAKHVTEMILPSLAEMIENAVASAFNCQNSKVTTQKNFPTNVELQPSNLYQAPPSLNQAMCSSQPEENYVSDEEDMLDVNGEEHISLDASSQTIRKSQLVEINVLDDDELDNLAEIPIKTPTPTVSPASMSPIEPLNFTSTSQHIPNAEKNIMAQALHKIQVLAKKPTATWSCKEQHTAMKAVLNLTSDVLALLRTGSGKTMLAVVPSLLEKHSITGVILPLKSLKADYIRKLDEMKVPYEEFTSTSRRISGSKNLVLVSMDRARSVEWHQALAEVNQKVKVVRLVVDEGHLGLTAEQYRNALKDLYELRQFPLQLVILTGTLQPISEKALMDSFGLAKNTIIIRTPTNRPELQYILEKPKPTNKSIAHRVLEIIEHHRAQLSTQDRALVFVPYIQEGNILATLLGCKFYNGGEETTDTDRQLAYDAWIQGTDKIMICTAAFGAGNDYPHVRLVIHAGTPQEMIGCIQEKSRAGRDGQPAKCYFLPRSPGKVPEIPWETIDHQGKVAMYHWLFPPKPICLRYGITKFCDGQGTYCHDDSTYLNCSVCQPSLLYDCPPSYVQSPTLKRPAKDHIEEAYRISKQRKIDKDTQKLSYVDKMKRSLDFFRDTCAYCKIYGKEGSKHDILHCPLLIAQGQHSTYVDWRNMIRYGKHHHKLCYRCHVPQCNDKLHGTFVKGSTGCVYPDIIAPVVYAICHDQSLLSGAIVYFKQKWNNLEELMTWLNGQPINGEKSNLTALFLWYFVTYCTNTR